jgi:hypothetical protein
MANLAELNRSISLDSAGNDFLKVAKCLAAARSEAGQAQRLASQSAV